MFNISQNIADQFELRKQMQNGKGAYVAYWTINLPAPGVSLEVSLQSTVDCGDKGSHQEGLIATRS